MDFISFEKLLAVIDDPYSQLKLEKMSTVVAISPKHLNNIKNAVLEVLQLEKNIYSERVDGVVMAVDNVKILNPYGYTYNAYPYLYFDVEASYIVFKPGIGCTLRGIINKIGSDHIGSFVHSIINASVTLNKFDTDIPSLNDACGKEIIFDVQKINTLDGMLSIDGSLRKDSFSNLNTQIKIIPSVDMDFTENVQNDSYENYNVVNIEPIINFESYTDSNSSNYCIIKPQIPTPCKSIESKLLNQSHSHNASHENSCALKTDIISNEEPVNESKDIKKMKNKFRKCISDSVYNLSIKQEPSTVFNTNNEVLNDTHSIFTENFIDLGTMPNKDSENRNSDLSPLSLNDNLQIYEKITSIVKPEMKSSSIKSKRKNRQRGKKKKEKSCFSLKANSGINIPSNILNNEENHPVFSNKVLQNSPHHTISDSSNSSKKKRKNSLEIDVNASSDDLIHDTNSTFTPKEVLQNSPHIINNSSNSAKKTKKRKDSLEKEVNAFPEHLIHDTSSTITPNEILQSSHIINDSSNSVKKKKKRKHSLEKVVNAFPEHLIHDINSPITPKEILQNSHIINDSSNSAKKKKRKNSLEKEVNSLSDNLLHDTNSTITPKETQQNLNLAINVSSNPVMKKKKKKKKKKKEDPPVNTDPSKLMQKEKKKKSLDKEGIIFSDKVTHEDYSSIKTTDIINLSPSISDPSQPVKIKKKKKKSKDVEITENIIHAEHFIICPKSNYQNMSHITSDASNTVKKKKKKVKSSYKEINTSSDEVIHVDNSTNDTEENLENVSHKPDSNTSDSIIKKKKKKKCHNKEVPVNNCTLSNEKAVHDMIDIIDSETHLKKKKKKKHQSIDKPEVTVGEGINASELESIVKDVISKIAKSPKIKKSHDIYSLLSNIPINIDQLCEIGKKKKKMKKSKSEKSLSDIDFSLKEDNVDSNVNQSKKRRRSHCFNENETIIETSLENVNEISSSIKRTS